MKGREEERVQGPREGGRREARRGVRLHCGRIALLTLHLFFGQVNIDTCQRAAQSSGGSRGTPRSGSGQPWAVLGHCTHFPTWGKSHAVLLWVSRDLVRSSEVSNHQCCHLGDGHPSRHWGTYFDTSLKFPFHTPSDYSFYFSIGS